jgi:hypothetical protein
MIHKPEIVYQTARNVTTVPVRLIEWKEEPSK